MKYKKVKHKHTIKDNSYFYSLENYYEESSNFYSQKEKKVTPEFKIYPAKEM